MSERIYVADKATLDKVYEVMTDWARDGPLPAFE